jgi:tRNA pseudouridine32 synthase / 23S rRNA pseudouridine746 synthase
MHGVGASRVQLPPGPWTTLLDGLCARFPAISRETWLSRFARARVLDAAGTPLAADAAYRTGLEVYYFREVAAEAAATTGEQVLYADQYLVVADKPHGLPVTPAGDAVAETLLARLVRRLGNPHLVPLHRIDRDTAGLVLFSADPVSRAAYHALFRDQRIEKTYEALAPALPTCTFPIVHRSRLVRGEPFFRMREAPGEPNSETRIDVMQKGQGAWRYVLAPRTGRKHQLRVHMAALGAPILGDILYPRLQPPQAVSHGRRRPLQLLARRLSFIDPMDQRAREYESRFQLCESGSG